VKPRLAAAARRVGSRPRVEHLRRCPPLGKPARRASASRGRHEGGSQAVVAVVLADCIDCRSRRAALGPRSKDRGSSSMARMPRGARAHRVKRRRKPDRGGESHQHASSETGGGLLVIPRAGAQAFCATGGGSTRTTEGVLARGERRLWRDGEGSGARWLEATGTGQQCSVRGRPWQRTSETISQARPGAKSARAEGRSAEGSTIVTPPGPRDAAPVKPLAQAGDRPGCSATIVEAGDSPSSEALPVAHSASGSAGSQPTAAGSAFNGAQGEPAREPRHVARREAARGCNQESDSPLVLVKGVGCRSRWDASFSPHHAGGSAGNGTEVHATRRGSSRRPRQPLTRQAGLLSGASVPDGGVARGERQGAGWDCAREQQARSSPPGPQGSGPIRSKAFWSVRWSSS